MSGHVELLAGGIGNLIQDGGRHGWRHMGIAVSGCLDPLLARCANALLGNEDGAATMEMRGLGPTLRVKQGPVRCALSGQVAGEIRRADGRVEALPAWRSATLAPGDRLRLGAVAGGTAYLALSGGIGVPAQLGSRATYARAGIGGLHGRLLADGDILPCGISTASDERCGEPWQHESGPIRVIAGPQAGHFSDAAWAGFLAADYRTTPASDRMGMRLDGPPLAHRAPELADIVSDAVTPGAIQVPGNGLPIILLADCQTVGGYPKIATVISADLPRLAQCRPGESLRFAAVDLPTAAKIRQAQEARWRDWRAALQRWLPPGYIDETALYGGNLISGTVRAEP